MKLKKLLAAVTAAALAVSTMAVSSFTASAKTSFGTGTWSDGKFVDNASTEMEGVSLVGVDKVTFNATASDLNYGWNGGQFYTNSNGKDYTSVTFGGSNKNATVTLEETGPFSVDVEIGVTDTGWFECGWGTDCAEGVFDLTSIDFYKGADKVGTWADGAYTEASSEDDDLPKNEWFKNEYGSDAYICTNGNAPEKALFVDVEALLDEGKTLADVSKITAIYAVSSINEAEQGVSGCFGVVHDVGGTNDWYDDIYSEWEWLASDSTAEEGKDCVIECADGLLDTDECQFQIDTMKANNVLVVDFQIDYKDESGDVSAPVTKWVESPKGTFTFTGGCETSEDKSKDYVKVDLANYLAEGKTLEDIESFTVSSTYSAYGGGGLVGCYADSKKNVEVNNNDKPEVTVSDFENTSFTMQWWWNDGTTTVKFTLNYKSEEPDQPAEPTSKVLWEGTQATDNWSGSVSSIAASEFANVKAGDKIAVTYTVPADGDGHQLSLKYQDSNWSGLPGFVAGDGGEWAAYNVSADGTYEHILTDADVAALKEYSIAVGGKYIVITKVELITSGGGSSDPEPPKPEDPKPGDDNKPGEDTKPDNTITTPSDRVTYPVVIPFGYTPATSEDITNAVSSTAEGDTASVNLTSNTRVDKAVLDTIAGKDITVEFKLKGGAKWVINGKNVEKAKKVDLGVRLRSKAIPAEKVSTVAGDNRTVQFSLRHNGDLGFTGALIIPFSSAYNGKFANLYYNNTAKDELEFVGSSKISAGQASFVFTHASDYVVVIDDEAYGEDVSSAAGVYETSEMTAAPYVAAVAVIAVLGAAAVVIKKRLAK